MKVGKLLVRRALANLAASLPDKQRSVIEYWFRPSLARGFAVLNDQIGRHNIFDSILSDLRIAHIIETGTFRGTTTEFFARTGLPVHTIEFNTKYYEYAKIRLRSFRNVRLYKGSSLYWLPIICDRLQASGGRPATLVYLDAHWFEHLPLREEIEILSAKLPNSVIMIDDFEVPGDVGYGFDDYGLGKRLSVDYLKTAKTSAPISIFFPSLPSTEETGQRRGTCIIGFTDEITHQLKSMPLLRLHSS